MSEEERPIYEQFGVTAEDYKKITLEVEHAQVDYRLSSVTEKENVERLFPNEDPKTQLKILYWGRVQYWSGYRVATNSQ